MSAREAYSLLLAAGVNGYDAYDLLADAGYDPHPNAPATQLSVAEVVACARSFFDANGGAA